jgi:hypothetical protein
MLPVADQNIPGRDLPFLTIALNVINARSWATARLRRP